MKMRRRKLSEFPEVKRDRGETQVINNEPGMTGKGSSSQATWFGRLALRIVPGGTVAAFAQSANHDHPTMLRGNELSRDFRREDPEYYSIKTENRLSIILMTACTDNPFWGNISHDIR